MKNLSRIKYPTLCSLIRAASPEAQQLKQEGDRIGENYLVRVGLVAEENEVWLEALESFKKGEGQKFMQDFVRAADKYPDVKVWLNAVPYEHNKMKPAELAKWYEMFGFKVYDKTDWTDGYIMVRKPLTK